MTPTALIAEDEPLLAAALQADLASLWPELVIAANVGDGLSAVAQALALRPSVCFLDIRMPGQTGLEAAQALAEDWPADAPFPLLVFVTAYDQYAVSAFEAQAVDYLVKPVETARLAACIKRLQTRLADRRAEAAPAAAGLASAIDQLRALLSAPGAGPGAAPGTAGAASPPRLEVIQAGVGNTVHLVPVAEVLYFEAADKYVRVVTADREHLIRLSLRELLPQLDAQVFWQVHRGLVVRASAIATAVRDESGKVFLSLRGRNERLTASRLYAHLFKGM
ncbi:LytTR family DNA-binding domain-containing protein [Ideonella sp. A 288]|uniref:LytR/AlgR family response regulator transcription factor n=1 Tax=Ideonella sp. A 288 TaxID=1962181 RepID=UPI000B4C1225|nr:LytTR family DNA-binding domain-containing protein [Ideonella sp. A 288]